MTQAYTPVGNNNDNMHDSDLERPAGPATNRQKARIALLPAAAVVALLFAVHFGVPIKEGLWFQTFFDALHVPVFALIAACLYVLAGNLGYRSTLARSSITVAGVFVLSGLSEAAQIIGPRDASLQDLVADWLGALGALFVMIAICNRRRSFGLRAASFLSGLAVLAFALAPLARVSAAYLERNWQLPYLVTFEGRLNHVFMRAQNARSGFTRSDRLETSAVRVVFGDGPWPGLIFTDVWPDWRGYDELVLEIAVVGEQDLPLNFRIHDLHHNRSDQPYSDRYNAEFELTPATTEIRVPLEEVAGAPQGRDMDMSAIHGMVIFAGPGHAGREFELASIRLAERDSD